MEKPFPLTESGDAEHFANAFADKVRFDHRRGRWLVFAGHRWMPDADGEVFRLGLEAMRQRQKEGLGVQDTNERKRHVKWTLGGESRRRIENMLEIAKSLEPIADSGDDWDSDPWLLGVENGVINLWTGRLRAGRPKDRITMAVRAPYEPKAACTLWKSTVRMIFGSDQELVDYVQRALGYSLAGITNEQCFFMAWGEGANGKGTLMNTVAHVLGDYADDLPFCALELQQRSGIPNDVAKLVGKRFVTSSESNDGIRLNEARVKALTGCDPITARFLHREYFTFQPAAKFWLATNHRPNVQDDSYGFLRRIRLIPFTQQFKGQGDDKDLKDKLRAEASGILHWLIKGCHAWQRRGLNPPQAVEDATKQYEAESDPITPFLQQACRIGPGNHVRAQHLYRAYEAWCGDHGTDKISQKRFGQRIRQRFQAREQNNIVTYEGVKLLEAAADPLTHPDPFFSLSREEKKQRAKSEKRVSKGRTGQKAGVINRRRTNKRQTRERDHTGCVGRRRVDAITEGRV